MRSASLFLGLGLAVVALSTADLPAQTPPPAGQQAGQQPDNRRASAAARLPVSPVSRASGAAVDAAAGRSR